MKRKIWLITGISSGLGKALAQSVMESGDFVVGTFRRQSQIDEFNKTKSDYGFAVRLDITDEIQIDQCIETIISKFGFIDVLVNNAGFGFIGAIEEASMREVRDVFEANFFGTLKLKKAVLPIMRKRGKGHIVQISSHGGIKAFAGFGIYNASKFALEGFSEALAQEVAPLGIKLTIVEPGPFRTNFAGKRLKQADKVINDYSTTAGAFREKLKVVDGKQEGDPVKASKAIIKLVASENPSLRLPLGKVALMTIGIKVDSIKSDLDKNREVAESVVYL
ncbi:oxidoreductase [Mangrovivirga cuniculi]|uniref:Short-chain dehydrogenase/reductase n=1 Tax=Mangrovivirga cuniculi TaxID=2715131 RepID=A0A4D7JRJ0_9BACT|nr:oxidoreductase [Mangrovivirga cuniculi]QCK16140.1 short-chain dehydrogenase/reductase [Mangrovivirga cuniculi]